MNESLFFAEPYFRLEKLAMTINFLANGKTWNLLDLGCGPATLAKLIKGNIPYYGIDIAIQEPAPNLLEMDITRNPIAFGDMTFNIVVAAGIFEFLGRFHQQKLHEISAILLEDGIFITTYTNFDHIDHERLAQYPIDNIMPIKDFKMRLERLFTIDSWYPCSHNWPLTEPKRRWLKKIQMPMRLNIPFLSRLLAINYMFICSLKINSYKG